MRGFAKILGAALSGGVLAMCFAPFDQAWLVWGWLWILLPLLWTTREGKRRRRGFGLGYVAGFVFWSINMKWIATVTGAGVFALAAYLAIYFGLFGAFAAHAGNPWRNQAKTVDGLNGRFREAARSLAYAALLGGFWCGLEWIRGWMLTGFGWNGLGVAFGQNLILAQSAEFVGVIGLAFLPVFLSAIVIQTARRFFRQARDGKAKLLHWDFATGLLVVMLSFTLGTIRLSSVINAEKLQVQLLLVQQDIPQVAGQVTWEPQRIVDGFVELTAAGLEEAERRTMEALQNAESEDEIVPASRPDMVVWPEACLPAWFRLQEDGRPEAGPAIESLFTYLETLGSFDFVTGANVIDGQDPMDPATDVFNSLLLHGRDGKRQTFHKNHLVYFGEALPPGKIFEDLYESAAGIPFPGGLTPGTDFEPLEFEVRGEKIDLMPSICFEDTVPRVTRRFVRNSPQLLVNITNDGWFQESEAAEQHFRNAVFRTIELRRPMVRCANRGVTGVISATGSVVDPFTKERRVLENEEGSHFHRGFLLASAYPLKEGGITLYAAFGDWFAVTGLVLGMGWIVVARVRGGKARAGEESP